MNETKKSKRYGLSSRNRDKNNKVMDSIFLTPTNEQQEKFLRKFEKFKGEKVIHENEEYPYVMRIIEVVTKKKKGFFKKEVTSSSEYYPEIMVVGADEMDKFIKDDESNTKIEFVDFDSEEEAVECLNQVEEWVQKVMNTEVSLPFFVVDLHRMFPGLK